MRQPLLEEWWRLLDARPWQVMVAERQEATAAALEVFGRGMRMAAGCEERSAAETPCDCTVQRRADGWPVATSAVAVHDTAAGRAARHRGAAAAWLQWTPCPLDHRHSSHVRLIPPTAAVAAADAVACLACLCQVDSSTAHMQAGRTASADTAPAVRVAAVAAQSANTTLRTRRHPLHHRLPSSRHQSPVAVQWAPETDAVATTMENHHRQQRPTAAGTGGKG